MSLVRAELRAAESAIELKDTTFQLLQLTVDEQKRLLSGDISSSMKDVTPRKKVTDKEDLIEGIVSLKTYDLKVFHPFYRVLVKSRKSDQLFKTGQNHLAKGIENKLTLWLANNHQPLVPIPILSNYLANEIFTLLKWWLDEDMPYTPERMDEIFHQLITSGFRVALGDK